MLPADAAARLHIRPEGFFVCIARAPQEATPDALFSPGQVHTKLIHDVGCAWPDRLGELLAEEALAASGAAVLVFVTLADALACWQRLQRGRRQ